MGRDGGNARTLRVKALMGVVIGATMVAPRGEAQTAGRGFLFRPPLGSVTLAAGFSHAAARGDLFADARTNLTLGRSAFDAISLGADVAWRVTPRLDATLGASYAGSSARSAYRGWLDQNDAPIEQTTSFERVPVTVGLNVYLLPRERSIGRFAWIPRRYALYVGASAGAAWYRYRQKGDFVDYQTSNVFADVFRSSAWTPAAQGLGGMDISLSPTLALVAQTRYLWARGQLGPDFSGYHRIDLSGLSTTLGFTVRF